MLEAPEPPADLDPASQRCLERTRSWVLNILVAVGLTIAGSGILLRLLGPKPVVDDARSWRTGLYAGLAGVVVLSRLAHRAAGSRDRLRPPETRSRRFFRSRVGSAVVGALAAPLGLAYGLAVAPRIEDVVVFWAAALVTGLLALPRTVELVGFPRPMTSDEGAER